MLAAWNWLALGIFLPAGETVSELAAIVCEELDDLDWTSVFQLGQKVGTAAIGLIRVDFHEDPAGCPVDGDEQEAARAVSSGISGKYLISMCRKPGS